MEAYRALGVCYYPEHWDKSLWRDDVQRMLDSGISTVRIAEFAWAVFEPREGEFNVGYFDDFLDICNELGMEVIFGTPTATPPIWMQQNYPEILNTDRLGHPFEGPRRNYTYNSDVYREFCKRIIGKLGDHYGDNPAIVGWQLDNEINCEIPEFFSEGDQRAFREYMFARFGTLEELNRSLGMTFWSQSYSDWNQVRLGGNGLHGTVNPHLALEEKRFFSASAIKFLELQIAELRPRIGNDVFITTNGLFENLDYNELMEAGLDFITFDSYPNFANDINRPGGACLEELDHNDLRDRKWSWNLAWTRSVAPTFGIMEQQSGPHGWTNRMEAPAPKPGQMRLWTMQSVAHGANMVSYFRWRTSPMGQEIYWHGLNDYSNRPGRRLQELKEIAQEWRSLRDITGATYQAKVAVLKDYPNDWDANLDEWHGRVARESDDAWFKATQLSHTPCDFLYVGGSTLEDLEKYELIAYPHAAIMTAEVSELLRAYVQGGGKLVMGARTGYKNETGLCPMRDIPGIVSNWIGTVASEYTLVSKDQPDMSVLWNRERIAAPVFSEILFPEADDVKVIATFDDDYYAGEPALVRRPVGSGEVWYLGACFSTEMVTALLEETGTIAPYSSLVSVPESMEVAVRADNTGDKWLFVLNYLSKPGMVTLKKAVSDAVTGERIDGEIELPAYGVGIYRC